ncbi:MAG: ABC transporter permease [Gemmatimonadota bacterium]
MKLRRIRALVEKDIRIYYAKGPVVIFGLLLPAFFFLAFTVGREMSGHQLFSGLVGMALWFTATSISPVIAPWESRDGTLERLVSSPASVGEIVVGDVAASGAVGISLTGLGALVLLAALDLAIVHPFVLLAALLLGALGFSSLGVLMAAVPTDSPADVMMLATMIKFPIIFVSGVFIPIAELPAWARLIAYASPLTYLVEAIRYSLGEGEHPLLWLGGGLAFLVASLTLAVHFHRKTLPRRLQ